RKQRARTPNEGFYRIQGPISQDNPVKFKFKPGEAFQSGSNWIGRGDVEVVALIAWMNFRLFVRALDEKSSVVTLSGKTHPAIKEDNARYYIENAPDALDA